jgi:hypothetical protein
MLDKTNASWTGFAKKEQEAYIAGERHFVFYFVFIFPIFCFLLKEWCKVWT